MDDLTPDPESARIFSDQWSLYRKMADLDYFYHREAYGILADVLRNDMKPRFRFLDLACGDARESATAIADAPIGHYRGIDLSPIALADAAGNLENLTCPVELEESDFAAGTWHGAGPLDVVWFGLSLHHLTTNAKREVFDSVHGVLRDGGKFLVFEPLRRDGESLDGFYDRSEVNVRANWTALTDEEQKSVIEHIRTCDLPEEISGWRQLGDDAGFSTSDVLFVGSNELYGVLGFTR